MYAIIETGGKQFKVSEGDVIRTDLVDAKPGKAVTFDRVVLAGGESVVVGVELRHVALFAGAISTD